MKSTGSRIKLIAIPTLILLAAGAVEQAEARVLQAQLEIGVLLAQLDQSRLYVTQAQGDARGRVSEALAQVTAAEASLAEPASAGYGTLARIALRRPSARDRRQGGAGGNCRTQAAAER
jgi:HlyD family secretion protein